MSEGSKKRATGGPCVIDFLRQALSASKVNTEISRSHIECLYYLPGKKSPGWQRGC